MALTPDEWQTAEWALQRDLVQEVFEDVKQVDEYIDFLIAKWNTYSPDAMDELKKVLWKGTEDWDNLLAERAAISGRLVLSEFTKNAINSFKSKS